MTNVHHTRADTIWLIAAALIAVELSFLVLGATLPELFKMWALQSGISWSPNLQYFSKISPAPSSISAYLFITVVIFPFKVALAALFLERLPAEKYAQFIISPRYRSRPSVVEYIKGEAPAKNAAVPEMGLFRLSIFSALQLFLVFLCAAFLTVALAGTNPTSGTSTVRLLLGAFAGGNTFWIWMMWSVFYTGFSSVIFSAGLLMIRDWIFFFRQTRLCTTLSS